MLLLSACTEENCGSGAACGCPREYCGDEYVSEVDNGGTFDLEVGQEIVERLADRSTAVEAYTTNSSVLKQISQAKKEIVSRPLLTTGFIAVGTGSARIGMVYKQCTESAESPCRFEFEINVVRLPKSNKVVSVGVGVNDTLTVSLRVGQSARLNAPSNNDDAWDVLIDNPNVLRWSFEPIVVPNQLSGVVAATGVGTAQVEAHLKSGSPPWWGSSWTQTINVSV